MKRFILKTISVYFLQGEIAIEKKIKSCPHGMASCPLLWLKILILKSLYYDLAFNTMEDGPFWGKKKNMDIFHHCFCLMVGVFKDIKGF